MPHCQPALVELVSDVKIPDVQVASSLARGELPVELEAYHGLVVLVQDSAAVIALRGDDAKAQKGSDSDRIHTARAAYTLRCITYS